MGIYTNYPAGTIATGSEKILAYQNGDKTVTDYELMGPICVFPETFGAVGDGVTDDSAAINAALSSKYGVVVVLNVAKQYYVGSSINVPLGASLVGETTAFPFTKLGTQSAYTVFGSQLIMAHTATVNVAGGLSNICITQAGLPLPVTSNASGVIVAGMFAGTAITATGPCTIRNCLVLGFAQAFYDEGFQVVVDLLNFDSQAGVYISDSYADSYVINCHGAPLLAEFVAGIPAESSCFIRTGNAFHFNGHCDWSYAVGNFCYKYNNGFVRTSCSNVQFVSCKSDSAVVSGFSNSGSGCTYSNDIGCTSIAGGNSIIHNVPTSSISGGGLNVIGGVYASATDNVVIQNIGGVFMTSPNFQSGTTAMNIAATTDSYSLINPVAMTVSSDFLFASGYVAVGTVLGNNKANFNVNSHGDTLPNPLAINNTLSFPPYVASVAANANVNILGKYNRAIITPSTPGSAIEITLGSDGLVTNGSEQIIYFTASCTVSSFMDGGTPVASDVPIAAGGHVHCIYNGSSWKVFPYAESSVYTTKTYTPLSGDSIGVLNSVSRALIVPSGAIASLTITLSSDIGPTAGQEVVLCFSQAVTSLALHQTGGGTVGSYSPVAGSVLRCIFTTGWSVFNG